MAIYSIIHKEVILYETVFGGINLNFLLTNIEFTLKANLWKNSGDQELINFAKIFTFDQHFAPNWSISHKDLHYKTMKWKGNLPYLLTSNIVTLSDFIYKWM